jgi:hypothetical protein
MSLTGLRAPGAPAASAPAAPQINYGPVRFGGRFGGTRPRGGNLRVSSYAGGGHMYNINELGPENRYSGGALMPRPDIYSPISKEGHWVGIPDPQCSMTNPLILMCAMTHQGCPH